MPIFETRTRAAQPELIRTISYPYHQHGRNARAVPKNKSGFRNSLFIFIGIPLLVLSFALLIKGNGSDGQVVGDSNAVAAMPAPEPIKSLDYTTMDATIQGVIAKNPGMDIGIATVDVKTGDTKTYGVEEVFVAASTAKLLTAIAFLHDVEQGEHSLTEKVGSKSAQAALEAMIVDSDNQAWYDFNNAAMSHTEMSAYAKTIGFTYDPDRNTTTATSLATLLGKLYEKQLINEEHTSLLLSYMQRAKEVEYIPNSVPSGVKVYHKPGYLTDRMHDAAIIDDGKRPYVLVIFTKARNKVYDSAAGAAVFNQTAAATYQTFLNYKPASSITQ